VAVEDVVASSADARPGALFCCVPGERADGHTYAPAALAGGAVALLVERWLDVPVPQLLVPSVRQAMGPVAAEVFGRPSERLRMVGVTGTNGKTTSTYLFESVFRAAGLRPGVIGTTGVRVAGRSVYAPRTTPEAPDLQRLLAGMVDDGVDAVAMEVSSHGLDQHRVDGTRYASALFTNLSQDHLDYHGTMEAYFRAKSLLFTPSLSDRGAVNVDSPEGRRLAAESEIPVVTFGLQAPADVVPSAIAVGPDGLRFTVDGVDVRSRLRASFNVANCLGVLVAARLLDIDDRAIAAGIADLDGVPGRLEAVDGGQPFEVLVDYAHTPDGIGSILRSTRPLAAGRLLIVFGCGGDRDRAKRPLMGRAATSLADLTVLTSDNPRSEDPAAIVEEIVPGARIGGGAFVVEVDRRAAIRLALAEARPGDVVLIAGKGHETGQELADRTIPFDDRLVAAEELAAIAGEGEGAS
jgi:UDP-N-acetylmuramoyl-L-alanyl-D-glutamate--2,6-diaminopimelate ligase